MEYITPLYLVSHTDSIDAIGNVIRTETTSLVYCKKKVVGSKEFYNATAVGITPTAELQLRSCEYAGQDEVIFEDKHFAVIRTLPIGKFDVVLVIGIKEGVN